MFIDTHCHLHFDDYRDDQEKVIQRAIQSRVNSIITIGTDIRTSQQAIALAEKYAIVYAAIGVHPNDADNFSKNSLTELEQLAIHKKVVAIGEIGLDYYRMALSRATQIKVFREQLNLAKRLQLPVIIHNREAHDDIFKILEEEKLGTYGVVLHSFSGSIKFMEDILNKNFYISFTGVITFKNTDFYKLIDRVPLQQLLLETDSPFLTPVPFRGKRNEPSYLKYIADKISKIKGISVEELAQITSENAINLFQLKKDV